MSADGAKDGAQLDRHFFFFFFFGAAASCPRYQAIHAAHTHTHSWAAIWGGSWPAIAPAAQELPRAAP
eukprot:167644-Prymnesium_polylepis.1